MPDNGSLSWGNIEVEFVTDDYDVVDVQSAIEDVERRYPGFADRVPSGTFIALSRHHFSGEFVGGYQIGSGAPAEVSTRAMSARKGARLLLNDIASRISSEIANLRPKGFR